MKFESTKAFCVWCFNYSRPMLRKRNDANYVYLPDIIRSGYRFNDDGTFSELPIKNIRQNSFCVRFEPVRTDKLTGRRSVKVNVHFSIRGRSGHLFISHNYFDFIFDDIESFAVDLMKCIEDTYDEVMVLLSSRRCQAIDDTAIIAYQIYLSEAMNELNSEKLLDWLDSQFSNLF